MHKPPLDDAMLEWIEASNAVLCAVQSNRYADAAILEVIEERCWKRAFSNVCHEADDAMGDG